MKSLAKIIAPALVAAVGLGAALPAQARDYSHDNSRSGYDRYESSSYRAPVRNGEIARQINDLGRDIDRAAARRTISQREAQSLRRDARDLSRLYTAYARNGLSRGEVYTLENRVERVRLALRAERRDGDRRRG